MRYVTILVLQSPCLSCSAVIIPREDHVLKEGPVHNGCGDEHNTSKVSVICLLFALTFNSKEVNKFQIYCAAEQTHALKLDIHASIYGPLLV